MTERRLARYVHVRDPHGNPRVLGPNDDVPEWARQRITNPRAWAVDGDGLPASPPVPAGDPTTAPGTDPEPSPAREPIEQSVQDIATETDPGDPEPADDVPDAPAPEPPPRGGRGSGAAPWRKYAADMGHPVPEGTERDDVIAALEAAGVRVE